jgi:hypothetical protein
MTPEEFREAIFDMYQVTVGVAKVPDPTRFRDVDTNARLEDYATEDLVVLSNYLSYGDYDNSTAVERANVAVVEELVRLDEEYGEGTLADAVVEIQGSMGGVAIGFRYTDPDSAETIVKDILDPLESYPLLDEGSHSDTEMEMFQEAWVDWGAREFVDKMLDDMEYEDDDDREEVEDFVRDQDPVLLFEAFDTVGEAWSNGYMMVEGGGNVYFDFDGAFKDKTGFDYYQWIKKKAGLGGGHGPWEDEHVTN